MPVTRRTALASLAALSAAAPSAAAPSAASADDRSTAGAATVVAPAMYGLIGKMRCVPGQRDALIAILLEGTVAMPGCLGYVVARDARDADALWITETWDSQASHAASLALPAVRAAIAKGRPLIAGFGERFETQPVGGHGLTTR